MMKLFAIISFAVLLRLLVGFQPHSGQDDYQGPRGSPSQIKYGGDYEAQRHWMEITYHLPPSEWYYHDLEYWGLDYPPLTAYVSWACGWVAHNVGSLSDPILGHNCDDEVGTSDVCQSNDDECLQPQSTSSEQQQQQQSHSDDKQQQRSGLRVIKNLVALHSSRYGYEETLGKMYMRFTVLLLDVIVYMSAVLAITKRLSSGEKSSAEQRGSTWFLITTTLTQPAIILIDHGHFQYNTASLGLALWSFHFMTQTSFIGPVVGSVLFSLALNFKQMELYHAPAVFAYLLGRCFCNDDHQKKQRLKFAGKFCALGISVLFTFAVLWLPFAFYPGESSTAKFHLAGIIQVLKRLFPFNRGLFEGKVSNIWCFLSTKPISIRERIPPDLLPFVATALTLVMIVPPCYMLFVFGRKSITHTPKKNLEFLLWGSVATSLAFFLASFQVHEKGILIPLAPLSLLALDAPGFAMWFSIVATWSLWPLLVIDRLCEAYLCCLVIFVCVSAMTRPAQLYVSNFATFAVGLSSVAMILLHLVEWKVMPPHHLPDLFLVLWSLVGCAFFCVSYAITIWAMAKNCVISRQRPQQRLGKGLSRKFFFFLILGQAGKAFSFQRELGVNRHHRCSFFSRLSSDDFILTTDLLERARAPLLWEQQAKMDSKPVLNLSARNSDCLSLADGFCDDAGATSDENGKSACSWEDGSAWRDTERELVAVGVMKSDKLTREAIFARAPQLVRLPTEQVLASARFFLGNCTTDESQTLESLLRVDPSLLTYKRDQLENGVEYLSNMMTRGNQAAAVKMILTQCALSPSMGLQLLKLGVDGGIEELRISQLLGSAGQCSGKAVKGVVNDMGKDIKEWNRVKGGKKSLGG